MTIKTKDRKARANYKRKIVTLRVELYPTDEDIKLKLERLEEPKATYVKRLIRDDIASTKEQSEGKWIKQKPDPEAMKVFHEKGLGKGMSVNSIYWTCSVCDNWGNPHHKYCSSCGAKMKGSMLNNAEKECPTCKHFASCEPSTIGACDQYEEVADDGR
jgi:NADH pyrophosphatase NudC (nudix superfamily)